MKEVPEALSHIPRENFIFDCHLLYGELMDTTTGTGWHSVVPMYREVYDALVLPEGVRRVGIASAVTDGYCFRRTPGAESDGLVQRREIDGHIFMNVGNPSPDGPEALSETGWPLLLKVNKHHTLIYEAGRELSVIRAPDGRDFVHLIAKAPDGGALFQGINAPEDINNLGLPEGWELRTEITSKLTIIDLPCPADALFFANGSSFQGPVDEFQSGH